MYGCQWYRGNGCLWISVQLLTLHFENFSGIFRLDFWGSTFLLPWAMLCKVYTPSLYIHTAVFLNWFSSLHYSFELDPYCDRYFLKYSLFLAGLQIFHSPPSYLIFLEQFRNKQKYENRKIINEKRKKAQTKNWRYITSPSLTSQILYPANCTRSLPPVRDYLINNNNRL